MHETVDLCNITHGSARCRCSTQHGAWIALRGLTSMVGLGLELNRNRSLHEPTVYLWYLAARPLASHAQLGVVFPYPSQHGLQAGA